MLFIAPCFTHFRFHTPLATRHMPHHGISNGSGPRRQVVLLRLRNQPSEEWLRKEACRSELQKEKSGTGKNRFFKQSVVTYGFVDTVRLPILV